MAQPELALTLEAFENDRLVQAEAAVRAFCGWHIAPSRQETLVRRARSLVVLPSMRVTAVTAVTDTDGNAVEFTFHEDINAVELSGCGTSRVSVTFTHGYDQPPADVESVVQSVARRALDSPGVVAQVGQVRYANNVAEALTEGERATLTPYRLPGLP